jgi:hypothetical protein
MSDSPVFRLRQIAGIPTDLFDVATISGIRSPRDLLRLAADPRRETIRTILAERRSQEPREAFLAGEVDQYLGMSRTFWEADASTALRNFCGLL